MSDTRGPQVLLVENAADYRTSLKSYLELEGFQVGEAGSVQQASEMLASRNWDVALVDLRLTDDNDRTDFSGLEVAKRAAGTPCIILTGFSSVETARQSLRPRAGKSLVADFLSKQESAPPAIADAIRAVLRDWEEGQASVPISTTIQVDTAGGHAWLRGDPLNLSPNQFALLAHLCQHAGRVCSRRELVKAVYGEELTDKEANLDRRIEGLLDRLRKKLLDEGGQPAYISCDNAGRGVQLNL